MRDAVSIVAGTVIGSGIFLVPNAIANQLPSFYVVMLVWTLGAALSLFGALALGELGAAFPRVGGLYVYLRQAFGKPIAFLYGWGLLTLIQSGSIATLTVAFRIYLSQLIELTHKEQKVAGIACILLLTFINLLGVRSGKYAQNVFTLAKLGGLTFMIAALFRYGHFHLLATHFRAGASQVRPTSFGIALIAVLWAFEGWHVVSFTAGEFRRPQRDLPRGLLYGTLIVAAIYLLANVAYYCVLTPDQIQHSQRVATVAIGSVAGGPAVFFITVLILVSIVGATNGMILTGPRVYYSMAQEGLFFPVFAKIHPNFRVPLFAILVQGAWAACLTLLGTFQELFTYVIFTAWIFYGLAVAGVVVLRVRRPEIERPFRVPFYPWPVVFFAVAAVGVTLSAVISAPVHALYGIGLILAGLPIYVIFVMRNRISRTTTPRSGTPLEIAKET